MNCMRGSINLKELRPLHYMSACHKGIKERDKEIWGGGNCRTRSHPAKFSACAYKGRQSYEFKVSQGQSKFRHRHGRNGDLRARSYPASLLSVLKKTIRSLNSLATLKKKCTCCLSLRIKGLRS